MDNTKRHESSASSWRYPYWSVKVYFDLGSIKVDESLLDFEKTFIQCVVFNYETIKELGDEAAVKSAGKVMTKGKDYVVEDGDIILIKAGAAKG